MTILRSPSDNTYCVPAALSCLMSIPVSKACDLIKEYLGDQPISGVYRGTAIRILKDHGYTITEVPFVDRYRVWQLNDLLIEGTYLVSIKGHVLVMTGPQWSKFVYDNSYLNGVSVKDYRLKKVKVEQVWKVERPYTQWEN